MTPEQIAFYHRVISPLEAKLLALPLGTLFTGILYDEDEVPVALLDLRDMGDGSIVLGPAEIGRRAMRRSDFAQWHLAFRPARHYGLDSQRSRCLPPGVGTVQMGWTRTIWSATRYGRSSVSMLLCKLLT